ncbi:MAG: hypothetical protein IPK74_17865 [Deltaproteobacteria bacterium]|nr:hypothetical protein [Deltaproteobacteria bacterium]
MRHGVGLILLGAAPLACFDPARSNLDGGDTGSSGNGSTGVSATDSDASASSTVSGTASTTASTTVSTTDADSSSGELPPLPCVESILEPDLGSNLVQIDTQASGDDFVGTCGGAGSPDAAFEWRVPYDGFFVLDTQGSDFDTVLYALDGACDGAAIGCSDNGDGVAYSQIIASFDASQRVVVVLDGNAGESGTAQLNINPVDCPAADVSDQLLPQDFSNVAGSNVHGGSCGGDGVPERAFRWTAPNDGLFRVRASSEDFTPAVYLETGPVCGGPLLGCNADGGTGRGEVVRALAAGAYVVVQVDSQGGTGDFTLDITEVTGMCPESALDGAFSGIIPDHDDVMTSSCGQDGYGDGPTTVTQPDLTLSWMSPGMVGGNSGCDLVVTTGFPASAALQEGACDGPESQCVTSTFDDAQMRHVSTVSVGHIPPTEFTLVVSPTSPSYFGWLDAQVSIEVSCWAVA